MPTSLSTFGFTGSRFGMTAAQKTVVERLLTKYTPRKALHGDCVGADAEFHDIVRRLLPACRIVILPPRNEEYRAHKQGDATYAPAEYLDRNRDIVAACHLLIACPNVDDEKAAKRSGTWYTWRYAGEQDVLRILVQTDGRPKGDAWLLDGPAAS